MGFFYINRDPDSLAHANHKYVSRKWSGGKWVYTYPEDNKVGSGISNRNRSNELNRVQAATSKEFNRRANRAANNTSWARESTDNSGQYNTAIASPTRKKAENESKNRTANEGVAADRSLKSRAKSSGVGEERKRKENKAIDTMTDHAARARGESREYYEESMYNRRKNPKLQAKSSNDTGLSTWGKLGSNKVRGAIDNKKVADLNSRLSSEGGKNRASNEGGVETRSLKSKENKAIDTMTNHAARARGESREYYEESMRNRRKNRYPKKR